MKFIITFFCAFLLCQLNAQVLDKTLTDSVNILAINATSDGGSIIFGNRYTNNTATLLKLDGSGQKVWVKDFTDIPTVGTTFPTDKIRIQQDSDGNFWVGVSSLSNPQPSSICKFDKDGNRLLFRFLPLKNAEINVLTNQLIVFGNNSSSNIATLLRLKPNGDTLNLSTVPSMRFVRSPYFVTTAQSTGLLVYGMSDSLWTAQTTQIGFDGTVLSRNLLSNVSSAFVSAYPYKQIIKSSDGNFYIPDSTNIVKINSSGQFLWRKTIALTNTGTSAFNFNYLIAPTSDGGMIGMKNYEGLKYLDIKKFNGDGVVVASSFGFYNATLYNPSTVRATQGGIVIIGNLQPFSKVRYIKLEENGYFYQYFVKGNVYADRDNNCQLTSGDSPMPRVIVTAKKTGFNDIFALSDSLGRYILNVDAGTYSVSVTKPSRYTTPCTPSVSKTLGSGNPIDSVSFPIKYDFYCGLMQVDIATGRQRRCFENFSYVSYKNIGTATAVGAYLTVTIDSLMEFVRARKPVASVSGRTYRFNLGDIAEGEVGSFELVTRTKCGDSTRIGQTLCMEAKIYPDTICNPINTLWSGADLYVTGNCQGDSVSFQVRNIGRVASTIAATTVVENLAPTSFSVASLPVNGIFTKKYPANGNTWRMIVNQEPNHPRSSQPTAFVEGCRRTAATPFITGFANNFPNDDGDNSIDVDCQQIIGAYDPNDKIGYPLGTGTTRAIAQNQDIEYMIRFQNTGTDTAFTVVVRDTIDIATLDLLSIEWGASSHAYKPQIYNENVVKFTFDNILLVDSFKNEPKSNGFVKFRIKQKKDVAYGTKIQNSAGIYFDFNDPVLTNKTLHTVSKNIVTATIDKLNSATETIKVYPNPASETLFFELENRPLSIARFELFDMLGKRVSEQNFEGKTFQFNRQSLPSGIYLFKISSANQTIGTGKIMIQ